MTDEETVMLTARVPKWLMNAVTALAIETGRTRTQVICDALCVYGEHADFEQQAQRDVDGSDPKVQPGNRQGEM